MADILHKIGDVLDNHFEVIKVMQGGMGQIFVCKDHNEENETLVVLKTFTADKESREYAALRDRFLREAEAWFRIGRANKDVDWFYLGLNGTLLIGGRPYLAMNYCPGGSLRDRMAHGPLSAQEAVYIATQVLLGLTIIDDKHGLIHRDLKPENILFSKNGFAAVSDLGIVKFLDGSHLQSGLPRNATLLTQYNSFIGTLIYAAPEQLVAGSSVDKGIDIWAFGVVLYEMLLGHRPFEGDTVDEVVTNILYAPVKGLKELEKRCGRPLVKVVEKCLEKRRDRRYKDFQDLIHDWDQVIRLENSPKKANFFRKEDRHFIDDPRVEKEWLEVFPERKSSKQSRWAVNWSAANRYQEAGDLLRIGKSAAALVSCKIVLETRVNGLSNLERLLAQELDAGPQFVKWSEGSKGGVSRWYAVPPKFVAEGALYDAMCCYVDIIETLREDPAKAEETERRKGEFLALCDRVVDAHYSSEAIQIMCAEGFLLGKRYDDSLALLTRLQDANPKNAKISAIYWMVAQKCWPSERLKSLATQILEGHENVDSFESKYLCARICACYNLSPHIERFSRAALAFQPDHLHVLHMLTGALASQSKKEEALSVYKKMYRIDPTSIMTKKTAVFFQDRP